MDEEYKKTFESGSRRAFTLLELLVVITILAVLAGAALPYVQNYVKESRIAKAKSDLEEIKKALAIYETREGTYKSATVDQLTGRYLNSSPIDPWGKAYVVATDSGLVYSSGPDRINNNYDDIAVNFQPPLALVQVNWIDANKSGAVDTQNVQDYLQLIFSRETAANSPIYTAAPAARSAYFTWTTTDLAGSLDWSTLQVEGAGNVATIKLANGVKDVFVAGSDTIKVVNGAGILDLAPTPNRCITDQNVIIKAQ
ncbi:MAG: type II secretion system protein [Candidatus Rifleibacteriota bacterium]